MYIYRNVHFPTLCPKGTKKPSNLHLSPNCWHGISNINHQKPPRLNTSITSICHNRKHHGQYINHFNQSCQKPPRSIHQSHQSVISDHPIQLFLVTVEVKPSRLNTSITSICHNRKHHGQYINHINQSYQKPPVSIHQSHESVISDHSIQLL